MIMCCDNKNCTKKNKCARFLKYEELKKNKYTGLIPVYNNNKNKKDCEFFVNNN